MSNKNNGQTSLDVISVLKYSVYVVWIMGVIGSIMWCLGAGRFASTTDVMWQFRVAVLFCGLLCTVVAGGILYGMSHIVTIAQNIKKNQEKAAQAGPQRNKPA